MPSSIRSVCASRFGVSKQENVFSGVETMNWKEFNLFGRNWVEHSFKTLVDRRIREGRREERRFADQCTTKHRLQARKSCIADARSYRVARRLPPLRDGTTRLTNN